MPLAPHHSSLVADAHNDLLIAVSGLPLVTEALHRRGLPEDAIRKILGGNVLDLFHKELGRPA